MVPVMSRSLDCRLGIAESFKLRLHLLVCAWCARYLRQIRFLQWLAGQELNPVTETAMPALTAEARARIARRLNDQGGK
jgi:hypothetical protein